MNKENLLSIIESVENHIIEEEYKGYDPYDLLSSPLFRLPFLNTNRIIRFGAQQVFRRIPFNIRPLFGITKEINPVTLGICIQSYGYLSVIKPEKYDYYKNQASKLIDILISYSSKGYSGYCWGYNFDWESRYSKIPKFMPTVVATGIIINGLFEYYKITKDENIPEILKSSASFVLNDLKRSYDNNTFCFSYSPDDNQKVYNASMKGARLLIELFSITNDDKYLSLAEDAVLFVINNQRDDGSWSYSKDDGRTWTDNFHTAYILDSLDEFIKLSGLGKYQKYLDKGLDYYLKNLFTSDGYPKYYSNSFYPIDATEVAQTIISLARFMKLDMAEKVIIFAINNLYSGEGFFYYQKNKIINKNSYLRWSDAWMYLAISSYLYKSGTK